MEAGSISSQLRLPVACLESTDRMLVFIFQRFVSAVRYCSGAMMLFGSKTPHQAQYLLLSQKGPGRGRGFIDYLSDHYLVKN
jgi:hypothetical protein